MTIIYSKVKQNVLSPETVKWGRKYQQKWWSKGQG